MLRIGIKRRVFFQVLAAYGLLLILANLFNVRISPNQKREKSEEYPMPLSSGAKMNVVKGNQKEIHYKFCGYQSCPKTKPGLINVHLVPHSHDDLGWHNTMDEYYSGSINTVHNVSVAKIIDSAIDQLLLDPSRKFIYAEIAFFQRWWDEQKEDIKDIVRDLVASGRLEFANGGWCMNDEGSTHYVDIINQMSLGLDFLNKTFGECGNPKVAWQINSFGHSREHASLTAQMGFDGMFLSRIDFQDKNQRMSEKNMEMIWSGSDNLAIDGDIFTGILYDHYTAPAGFCFDEASHTQCHDKALYAKDTLHLDERVSTFLTYAQRQAESFGTNNIMITMGHDFAYQNARTWFNSMDTLIKAANSRRDSGSKFNLFYSTPACYLKALHDHQNDASPTSKKSWTKKTDDFFPYGSTYYEYWTGCFTSRPSLKHMVRQGSNLLQSCKQMASALKVKRINHDGDISVMKKAMAIVQHTDAVSGTEKQRVADDYVRILHQGVEKCQKIQNSFYRNFLPKNSKVDLQVSFCHLNSSQCNVTENADRFIVNVYNPIPRTVDKYVRVPVNINGMLAFYGFEVLDANGGKVASELLPLPEFVKNLPGRDSQATHDLVLFASQLPPLGSKSFYVGPPKNGIESASPEINESTDMKDITISNEKIEIQIDERTGLMKSFSNSNNGLKSRLEQEFLWYSSSNGSDGKDRRASGAYMFRPLSSDATPTIKKSKSPAITKYVYKGKLVQEVHQYHNEWIGQVIRLYKGADHVEFDWVIGPIPTEDGLGKEVITRYKTDLSNGDTFYTDSNGRQTMKRRRAIRESFEYVETEPVAGNYYPINSHIYIKDSGRNSQLTVFVDRSQGGSSLQNGQVELMLHRRLTHEDGNGIGEILDEVAHGRGLTVRGTHYITLSGTDKATKLVTSLSQEMYKQPQLSFYETKLSFEKWSNLFNAEVKLLNRDLPENVNLLTFEPRSDGDFLLRLEHITFEDYSNEKDIQSLSTTVDLKDLFSGLSIETMQETMLGGNEWKKDSKRLVWKDNHDSQSVNSQAFKTIENDISITLNPKEIRTFIITLLAQN